MNAKEESDEKKKDGYSIRTYKEGDDKKLSELFAESSYGNALLYWTWKYKMSPYFDPNLIIVAIENSSVVGGTHAQKRTLKIDKKLTIPSSIGSGLMVSENHRKRGIATKLMTNLRKNLRDNGVILHYSVPEKNAFRQVYSKRYALMVGKQLHMNFRYSKRLIKNSLTQKLTRINSFIEKDEDLRKKLEGINLKIGFKINSFPTDNFTLTNEKGRFIMYQDGSEKPDITITTKKMPKSVTSLLSMLIKRDLKTKGLIRNIFKISRNWRILRKISTL